MEQIIAFQEKIKNKIKEKLQEKLKNEITQKEEEIEKIKSKYENQVHKEGFLFKIGIQNVKNNDISMLEFCTVYLSPISVIISTLLIIFIFPFFEKNSFIGFISFVSICILFIIGFISSLIMLMLITEGLNGETELTSKYKKLIRKLDFLHENLLSLNVDVEDYVDDYIDNCISNNYKNKDDIQNIINDYSLSKEELAYMSKIFNKEEMFYLSIVSIRENIKSDNIMILKYRDVLTFIKIKKQYHVDELSHTLFNT